MPTLQGHAYASEFYGFFGGETEAGQCVDLVGLSDCFFAVHGVGSLIIHALNFANVAVWAEVAGNGYGIVFVFG